MNESRLPCNLIKRDFEMIGVAKKGSSKILLSAVIKGIVLKWNIIDMSGLGINFSSKYESSN